MEKLKVIDMAPLPVTDIAHVMREVHALRKAREAIREQRQMELRYQYAYLNRKRGGS